MWYTMSRNSRGKAKKNVEAVVAVSFPPGDACRERFSVCDFNFRIFLTETQVA